MSIEFKNIDEEIRSATLNLNRLKEKRESLIIDIKKNILHDQKDVSDSCRFEAAISYLMREEMKFFSKYKVSVGDDKIGLCYVEHYTFGGYPIRVGYVDNIKNVNNIDVKSIWKQKVADGEIDIALMDYKKSLAAMKIGDLLKVLKNYYKDRFVRIEVPELFLSNIFVLLPEKHVK